MQTGGTDQRIHNLDRRVDDLGHRTELGLTRIETELRSMRADFGAYQRTVIRVGGGLIGILALGVCAIVATQL